jgi:hypothetical protein
MDAVFEGEDAERGMLEMRRGNDHGVHESRLDQFFAVVKNFQRLVFFKRRGEGVAHGDEFAAVDFAGAEILGVVSADISHADDAQAHFVHARSLKQRHEKSNGDFGG